MKKVTKAFITKRLDTGESKPIDGYNNYLADINGQIYKYSKHQNMELTQTQTVKGYRVVNLNNGGQKTYLVHRLIAMTMVPNPIGYTDVHHLNSNREDNRAENLMWVSHAANMRLIGLKENVPADRICPHCGDIQPPD